MSETRLPLPPRRTLPADVRERMRRRVLDENRGPERRPNRRGPLVAAAAVVLLVAGGAVVARSGRGDAPVVAPPASTSVDPTKVEVTYDKTTGADLAKCAVAGLVSTHTILMPGRRIVVGDGPVRRFCEITYTRVSVSLPDSTPIPLGDGAVSILWHSPSDVFVGQAPRSTTTMRADRDTEPRNVDLPKIAVVLPDGLFVLRTGSPVERVEFRTEEPNASTTVRVVTADLPGPEWSTSRDAYPSGDATPDRPTNQVARCFDTWLTDGPPYSSVTPGSSADPADPADWHWTVRVGQDGERGVLVLRDKGGATAYCSLWDGVVSDLGWASKQDEVDGMFEVMNISGKQELGVTIFAGTVPERVGSLEFTLAGQAPVKAEIAEGTFAVLLTGPATAEPLRPRDFAVKVTDTDGHLIYQSVTK